MKETSVRMPFLFLYMLVICKTFNIYSLPGISGSVHKQYLEWTGGIFKKILFFILKKN